MSDSLFTLDESEEKRSRQLHRDSIVVDGLIATDHYLSNPDYDDHLHRGGVTAANFTVASTHNDFTGGVESVTAYRDLVERNDDWRLVKSAADIRRAKESDEIGLILGFQDMRPIGPDLSHLRAFDALGVRIVQLTYNDQNYVGAGCCERNDDGLSNFGYDLIAECNDRGLLVDLSHCGETTTVEAIEASDDPVAFTHVGSTEFVDAPGRNKTNEQLRVVAENGGVIGVTFFPPLVKRDPETLEVLPATIHDVLDQIDHVVGVTGIDHVAFGSDINDHALDSGETPPTSSLRHYRPGHPEVFGRGPVDTYDPYPEGVHRHTELENLTRGLVARDYDDDEVRKILGGNFLRVFDEVWED